MTSEQPERPMPSADRDRDGNEKIDSRVQDTGLNDAEVQAALQDYVPDTAEEKKLVRRIDMILVPILWWMYVLAWLDRGNIVRRAFSIYPVL
jgi:hypothetical protein